MRQVDPKSMRFVVIENALDVPPGIWQDYIEPALGFAADDLGGLVVPLSHNDQYIAEQVLERINETTLGKLLYRLQITPRRFQKPNSVRISIDVVEVTFLGWEQ